MRIDRFLQSNLNEEEQRMVRLMRVARAVAGALLVGGFALIAISSGPFNAESEVAGGGAPASGGFDRSTMTLESGIPG